MGLFDWVALPFKCPFCNFEQARPSQDEEGIWQTKATECLLNVYKKGSKLRFGNAMIRVGEIEMHNVCPSCKKYVSANVLIKNGKLTDKINYPKKKLQSRR